MLPDFSEEKVLETKIYLYICSPFEKADFFCEKKRFRPM